MIDEAADGSIILSHEAIVHPDEVAKLLILMKWMLLMKQLLILIILLMVKLFNSLIKSLNYWWMIAVDDTFNLPDLSYIELNYHWTNWWNDCCWWSLIKLLYTLMKALNVLILMKQLMIDSINLFCSSYWNQAISFRFLNEAKRGDREEKI